MKNLLLPPDYYYLLRIRSVFTSIDSGCKRTSDIRAKDFKGLFDCHCTRKEKKSLTCTMFLPLKLNSNSNPFLFLSGSRTDTKSRFGFMQCANHIYIFL